MSSPSRVLAGRIGGYTTRSRNDPMEYTKASRSASRRNLDERLLAEIDERAPGLPVQEPATRLEAARSAHYAGMSRKGVAKRQRNARARQRKNEANAAEVAKRAEWR